MIRISENIHLKEIKKEDTSVLFKLMQVIYPPAYKHFWKDAGNWYVNTQYSKKNIQKELSQENADYYFILFNDEIIGNFRILWDEKLAGLKGMALSLSAIAPSWAAPSLALKRALLSFCSIS